MKILGIVLLVLLIAGVAVVASGCGHHRGHKDPTRHLDYMKKKISKKLDLDEAQTTRLAALKQVIKAVHDSHHASKQQHRSDFMDLLSAPRLDQQQALSLIGGHTAFVNDNAPQVVTAMAAFYDSLRPDQQQQLRDKIQRHHHGRHHGG